MFYTQDEYDFQVEELLAQGLTLSDACAQVNAMMAQDEAEYVAWLEKQTAVEHYPEFNDSWYEDQYNLEAL